MIVVLKPIGKKSWSNVIKYKNCYEDIKSYYTRSGMLYTGLTPEEATRLGEKLGLDLSPSSVYWTNFFIRTNDKAIYLNTEDPLDELRYIFLKNHKYVKSSLFEYKASARFLLENKEEEAKKSNLLARARREAMREFDNLTADDMRKCLRLFGHSAETMNNEIVEKTLFEIVDANAQAFLDRWVHNKTREIEVLIERAVARNVIRKNKTIYKYGSDIIGNTLDDAISYLNNPKNQDLRIAITKQVESKMNFDGAAPILAEDKFQEDNVLKAPVSKVISNTVVDEDELAFNAQQSKKGKSNTNTI